MRVIVDFWFLHVIVHNSLANENYVWIDTQSLLLCATLHIYISLDELEAMSLGELLMVPLDELEEARSICIIIEAPPFASMQVRNQYITSFFSKGIQHSDAVG